MACLHHAIAVVSNYKITKSESYSQLLVRRCESRQLLYLITKLQNLKAIHNMWATSEWRPPVVSNYKITKSESYSQRYRSRLRRLPVVSNYKITKLQNLKAIHNYAHAVRCDQGVVSNYKIWKLFTTSFPQALTDVSLYLITKLQNLKAIHNEPLWVSTSSTLYLITKLQNLKAIHNSKNSDK